MLKIESGQDMRKGAARQGFFRAPRTLRGQGVVMFEQKISHEFHEFSRIKKPFPTDALIRENS